MVLINSPADRVGIREEDVIIRINGHPVKDRQELATTFMNDFTLPIRRGKEEKDYVVHVEQ